MTTTPIATIREALEAAAQSADTFPPEHSGFWGRDCHGTWTDAAETVTSDP